MMQRNVRGEITAALVVVLLVAGTGLAALLISNVSDVSSMATASPVVALEATAITTVAASETFSSTARVTASATATRDATSAITVRATEEATARATDVLTPTETVSEIPTGTETEIGETAFPTSRPTRLAQIKMTPTRVATKAEAEASGPLPTATLLPTIAPPITATSAPGIGAGGVPGCNDVRPPEGWTTYTVQPGNTLFSIARAVGSSVGELRDSNCIRDVDNIYRGQVLFVPRVPNVPVQTGVPRLPEAQMIAGLGFVGCTSPASSISSPAPGERITGSFTVRGTATHPEFQYYRLEVRPDFTNIYNFYSRSETMVTEGPLGQVNSDLFDSGLHWVRLTVVDRTGNFIQPCAVPVIFD